MFTGLCSDLRDALRGVRRDLRFHLPLVLLLALPVAALVVAAAGAHTLVLAPPPFPRSHDLVLVSNRFGHDVARRSPASAPELLDYRERLPSLAGLSAVNSFSAALGGDGGRPEQLQIGVTSGDVFETLATEALHGRLYGPADDTPLDTRDSANSSVLVLGHALWRRRYGGDPAIVGRLVRVGGTPMRVIGILPADFRLRLPPGGMTTALDAWTPLRIDYAGAPRDGRYLTLIGRLRPGRTVAQLALEGAGATVDLRRRFPAYERSALKLGVEPLHEAGVEHLRPTIVLLTAAAVVVLLLACVNAAGMLLARLVARGRELAIRVALGAGAGRLVRRLAVEIAVSATLATGLGLVVGIVLVEVRAGAALHPELATLTLPPWPVVGLIGLGLLLTLAASLALLGAIPAMHTTGALAEGPPHQRGPAALRGGWPRLRGGLIAVEVALSVLLVVAAGLLLRSALTLRSLPLGFEAEQVMSFRVALPFTRYPGPARWAERYDEILRELGSVPGVEAVGLADALPASGDASSAPFATVPARDREWGADAAVYRTVSAGYFAALRMPLLAGRTFDSRDRPDAAPVVVVDEALARRLGPRSPVGGRLEVQVEDFTEGYRLARIQAEVVGVVATVPHDRPDRHGRGTIYLPLARHPVWSVAVAMRTDVPPWAVLEPARRALAKLDPELPAYDARTLVEIVGSTSALTDLALTLLAAFATLALSVAAAGLFALVAYVVHATRRDQAIRLACGASPARLLGGLLRTGLAFASAGIVAGLTVAWAAAGRLEGLLVGIRPADPMTLVSAAVLVLAVAALSTLAAAIGVVRTEPGRVLREG